LQFSVKQSAVN